MVNGYISAILLSSTILLADSGYNTIYLMEFENMQNDFTNSHLTEALPDLIKENYNLEKIFGWSMPEIFAPI